MAVAVDTSALWTSPNSSGANTLSYTMGSVTSGLLVVVVQSGNITGVTYNGGAMNKLADGPNSLSYYYLQNPVAGAHNVVVTRSSGAGSDLDGVVISFSGAKQSGNPFGTVQSNSGTSKTGLTNNFTTLGIGSMILDLLATDGNPLSSPTPLTATGTGHTIAQQNYQGAGDQYGIGVGYTAAATAASYSIGYSWTSISVAADWGIDYYEISAQPSGTAYTITAALGTFILTGIAATLTSARKITAAFGSFTLTGIAATFSKSKGFSAAVGMYALTGTATAFKRASKVTAAFGSFVLTGEAASLSRVLRLIAAAGQYVLTGFRIHWPAALTNQAKHTASPTNLSKHSATLSNAGKHTASIVNQPKS